MGDTIATVESVSPTAEGPVGFIEGDSRPERMVKLETTLLLQHLCGITSPNIAVGIEELTDDTND